MNINLLKNLCFNGLFFALVINLIISIRTNAADSQPVQTSSQDTEQTQTEKEKTSNQPVFPEDTSQRFSVKELRISGNTLISSKKLLDKIPLTYNESNQPLQKTSSQSLYDFSVLQEIISQPGQVREVSARTIQGLTKYILSEYESRHYSGIYVYVPKTIITENQNLKDDILLIQVIEATANNINFEYFNVTDQNQVDRGYLRKSILEKWSPVKSGQVANQKKLDNFVNLLNLNPDRHVTVGVTAGTEPNTLDFNYKLYEAKPWHYFVQVDNSGTDDRKWSPRVGLINTNLFGFDDKFSAIYQAKPDSTIDENYSIFGNYDVPVMGPKLRLNLFAGHSEFDINPESGFTDFLGRGTFYGALLRYNLLQKKNWFFDITSSLSNEKSKVTPTLFPTATSDVEMDMFGLGAELYRSDDVSNTAFSLNRQQSIDTSSQQKFNLARTNADTDFSIITLSASHNRYIDKNKIGQLRGNVRWITSDERLVPAKMTSFGGMYSVRGYDEYEIVADGGILASIQYEFNWLRYEQVKDSKLAAEETEQMQDDEQIQDTTNEKIFTKIVPLVFVDYGRTDIVDPVLGENDNQTLLSVGIGSSFEIKKNLSGAIYYGCPLKDTLDTDKGHGNINLSFMLRW